MSAGAATGLRVVSGMRPTGRLHLGHYHGVLRNWIELQDRHECFFFVADWHALTTHYEEPAELSEHALGVVADWLACGVSPGAAVLFVQSRVPEHAELHLLLSMITPLAWLERVPSYKELRAQQDGGAPATYGFLGYPLLQAADILAYKAERVPVGEDQVAHVEFAREVARHFNRLYGREDDFDARVDGLLERLGRKAAELYRERRRRYRERGDRQALAVAREMLHSQQSIPARDRERLLGHLEGEGRMILPEPAALLTEATRVPGTDGRKMSKSYANTIALRAAPDEARARLRGMVTDPARARRGDPGDPEKCPVWELHRLYSDAAAQAWAAEGCRSAGIGCTDCKGRLLEALEAELAPRRAQAEEYLADRAELEALVHAGCERAREAAHDTLEDVREAMGLDHA